MHGVSGLRVSREMPNFDDKFLEETISTALGDPKNFHVPKGISRYDYSDQHGWWVRIRRDDAPFQQFFWDSHYPSLSEGLRAAIEYRHEIISSFPLERKRKGKSRVMEPDPEKRISRRVSKGKQQPYEYWFASWYDENHVIKHKSVSVNKFGEDGARKIALEAATKNHNPNPKPEKDLDILDPYENQTFKPVSREEIDIWSTVKGGSYRSDEDNENGESLEDESYPYGYEGERILELHLSVERDRKLRDTKIREFIKENGDIYCEVCSFKFTEAYPFLNKNIIEVHHIVPLSQLSARTKITLDDLILLCANCHLAVHQGDEEENLILAMDHYEKGRC